jgi:hypothetical protein
MTLEDQIAALLAQAEPLRAVPDEEAEAAGLPALVDGINALRARQAKGETDAAPDAEPVKRGPGRPRKAE